MLESEKTTLNKPLEEAKVVRDEAIVMATSLESEQKKLIQLAKDEAEEKLTQVVSEK